MHNMSLSFRRGVSTVLGALIFICIILTCVVPMWITKQQADLFYDRAVADMRQFDIERAREDLSLLTSTPVNVARVWFDDGPITGDLTFPFRQDELNFPGISEGTYNVMVVTERGKTFETELNYVPPVLSIIWSAPWVVHHITVTETEIIKVTNIDDALYETELDQFAGVYKTDLYQTRIYSANILTNFYGEICSYIDSCALVHLEGSIPSDLMIRVDITVLKDKNAILIPWSYTATFACYWMDGSELRITPIKTYNQGEHWSIPDKDHHIVIPTIPSYQNPLGDAPGEPNAIILEFDFSSIVDVGVYSIDISLSILGEG